MISKEEKNYKLMLKIVYTAKHVQLKWSINISNGAHPKEMEDQNSN